MKHVLQASIFSILVAILSAQPFFPCASPYCSNAQPDCSYQIAGATSATIQVSSQSYNLHNPLSFSCRYKLEKITSLKSYCFKKNGNDYTSTNNLTLPLTFVSGNASSCNSYFNPTFYAFFQNNFWGYDSKFANTFTFMIPGCPFKITTGCSGNNFEPCEFSQTGLSSQYNNYPNPCGANNNQVLVSQYSFSGQIYFKNNNQTVYQYSSSSCCGINCAHPICVPGPVTSISTSNSVVQVQWTGSTYASVYLSSNNILLVGDIAQNVGPNVTQIRFVNPYNGTLSSLVINGVVVSAPSTNVSMSPYFQFNCVTKPCLISRNGGQPAAKYFRPFSSLTIVSTGEQCYESIVSYSASSDLTLQTWAAPNSTTKAGPIVQGSIQSSTNTCVYPTIG